MATLVSSGPGTRHEKESLKDTISRIDPAECPLYANTSKGSVTATKHEWTVQELEAVNAANFTAEGADSTDSNGYSPDRFFNYVSRSTKDGKVSGTYNRISTVGGQRETNRQKLLKGLSLRRDLEAIISGVNVRVGAGTYEMGGIQTFITNTSLGATGSDATGDGSDAPTVGTLRAFDTIDYVDDAMEEAYNDGGNPTALYMSPGLKRKFSKIADANAAGSATSNEITQSNREPLMLVGSVSAYLSDFGRLEIMPSRHMAAQVALGIDHDHVTYMNTPGGSMMVETLGKVGDSDKFLIVDEGTLEVSAPKAHMSVVALNPAL